MNEFIVDIKEKQVNELLWILKYHRGFAIVQAPANWACTNIYDYLKVKAEYQKIEIIELKIKDHLVVLKEQIQYIDAKIKKEEPVLVVYLYF